MFSAGHSASTQEYHHLSYSQVVRRSYLMKLCKRHRVLSNIIDTSCTLQMRAFNLLNFVILGTHSPTFILNTFSQDYSLGYNYITGTNDAFPFYSSPTYPKRDDHGTAVAGVIAAVKDNNVCGVGEAYYATLTGKLLLVCLVASAIMELCSLCRSEYSWYCGRCSCRL